MIEMISSYIDPLYTELSSRMVGSSGAPAPAAAGPGDGPEFVLPDRVYILEAPANEAVCVKRESVEMSEAEVGPGLVEVKKEPSASGVSAAAARAGLYAGHEVRGELVLGPVCLERTTPRVLVKAEAEFLGAGRAGREQQEPQSETAGSCESEQELQRREAGREPSRRRRRCGGGGGRGGLRGGGKTGRSKKKKAYSKAQLNEALREIKLGTSLYAASKKYRIPQTTLRDKRDGKSKNETCGAQTVLNVKEETALVDWIHYLGKSGFRVTKEKILQEVANVVKILNRPNPFKNDVPGKRWYQNFLKRHPIVSKCVTQNRNELSAASVRAWFRSLEAHFTARRLMHVFRDPRRIFNCGELSLFLCPKKRVIVRKGSKTAFNRVEGDEKECLSVLVNVSADGGVAPPMPLFPHKTVPRELVAALPEAWGCCGTETGGATAEAFYEYITACFHPWLVANQIPLPVVLFLDHTALISIPLSVFCRAKAIILIALLPDSAHGLRPLDAAVFRTVEETWPGIVRGFRGRKSATLRRIDFAAALKTCFECLTSETIQSGFRCCGLYPFDPSIVIHSLLKDKQVEEVLPIPDKTDFENGFDFALVSQTLILGDQTDSGESSEQLAESLESRDSDQLIEASVSQESQHRVSTQETPASLQTLRLCRETLHVPEMVPNRDRGHCRVCLRNGVLKKLALKCSPCEVFLCPGGCWRQWHSVEELPGRSIRTRKSRQRLKNM